MGKHTKPRTEEHKRKLGLVNKGKKRSEVTLQKISISKKGQIVSKETREKLSKALKGKKKGPFSKAHRKALSEAHMGVPIAVETLIKRSNTIAKNRIIDSDDYCDAWADRDYVNDLRKTACERCGITNYMNFKLSGYRLTVHHIDEDKQNCHPLNTKTLCTSCHAKIHAKTRKPVSQETRDKLAKLAEGHKVSEKTKQKIRESLKRNKV